MHKRYFTVEEANDMIPDLEERFVCMIQLRTQIRQLYARLDQEEFAPDEEDFPIDPPGASPAVTYDLASLKALMSALEDQIEAIEQMGCLVKGIEPGLVDWYARRDGREIFLCWAAGEKRVSHWHEIEAGFAGRRSVEELRGTDAYPVKTAKPEEEPA